MGIRGKKFFLFGVFYALFMGLLGISFFAQGVLILALFIILTIVRVSLREKKAKANPRKEDMANRAFDILVEHAGAPENWRGSFIHGWGTPEFRFIGMLGFGGKFWVNQSDSYNNGKPYVNCYPEDLTPERGQTIENVNRLLATLE